MVECEAIEIEDEIQSFENEFVMVDEIPEPPMEYVGEYEKNRAIEVDEEIGGFVIEIA